jgi:hypothetical protein
MQSWHIIFISHIKMECICFTVSNDGSGQNRCYGSAVWVLVNYTTAKLPNPLIFITGAVTTGIPGIAIQLLLIPPIVIMLRKRKLI